jgi:hypothetical protein
LAPHTHTWAARTFLVETEVKEQVIQMVRSWIGSLPTGAVTVSEEQAPSEFVIQIRPARQGAADVELRIADYGTFGLYVSAIRIEDLPLSEQLVLEVLEAVKEGHVEEEVWERSGKVQRRHTVLRLPSRELHGREDITIGAVLGFGLGRRSVRSFAPFI